MPMSLSCQWIAGERNDNATITQRIIDTRATYAIPAVCLEIVRRVRYRVPPQDVTVLLVNGDDNDGYECHGDDGDDDNDDGQ